MTWLIYLLGILLIVVVGLAGWRALDHRADQTAWERLTAEQAGETTTFHASMTAGLPEPAQRYFHFTIAQGTPLFTAVEIDMTGEIGLGSKDAPGYRLPTRVGGGNLIGTPDYLPFFKADVTAIRFPQRGDR